jgi:hypothetical protein
MSVAEWTDCGYLTSSVAVAWSSTRRLKTLRQGLLSRARKARARAGGQLTSIGLGDDACLNES